MKVVIKETKEIRELDDVVSFYVTNETITAEEFEEWEKIAAELHELSALIKEYRHRYGDEVIDRWLWQSDVHFVEPEYKLWLARRELFELDLDYILSLSSDDDDNDDDDNDNDND